MLCYIIIVGKLNSRSSSHVVILTMLFYCSVEKQGRVSSENKVCTYSLFVCYKFSQFIFLHTDCFKIQEERYV